MALFYESALANAVRYLLPSWWREPRREAMAEFRRWAEDRISHGYEQREGSVPSGSTAVAKGR